MPDRGAGVDATLPGRLALAADRDRLGVMERLSKGDDL